MNLFRFNAVLRAAPLLWLFLSACAATQSASAFTPRSASAEELVTVTADKAGQHDQALSDSLERSLERQEKDDQTEPATVEPQKQPTRDTTAGRPLRGDSVAIVR